MPYGLVRFVTGTMEKRSYTIRTPFVAVGVRGTTFDMLVRRDRVTVLLIEGGVELTVQPRGTYLLERPNIAITIWRDGRVTGPREWNRSVTDLPRLRCRRSSAARRPRPRLQGQPQRRRPRPQQAAQAASRAAAPTPPEAVRRWIA